MKLDKKQEKQIRKQATGDLKDIHTDVLRIQLTLYGNGQKGICDRIDESEEKIEKVLEWKNKIVGALTILAVLLTLGLLEISGMV